MECITVALQFRLLKFIPSNFTLLKKKTQNYEFCLLLKYMKGEVVECIHSNINYMKENSKLCEYLVHMSECVETARGTV